jgi:DNA-binding transcriptional MocR family regulator
MTRYLQIAEEIADLIAGGSLRPGDALPSVRLAAEQRKVSKGTVIQAYSVLEARRLIDARPQSGFYVLAQPRAAGQLPRAGLMRPNVVRSGRRERVRDTLGDLVGSRVTSLGSSFPDPSLLPLQALNRALSASSRHSRYATTVTDLQLGLPELRRAIAQRYLELGYTVPMEDIIVTCGGTEAISLSLQAVTKPGDLVLIDSPMFFSGLQLMEQFGLGAIEMPTDAEQGLDLGMLDATLQRHKVAACLLMTNCQNPLGFSLPEEKKRALVKLFQHYDVPLVENDVYSELQFDFRHNRAAKAFDKRGSCCTAGRLPSAWHPGSRSAGLPQGDFTMPS